jgi:hypothetical protein
LIDATNYAQFDELARKECRSPCGRAYTRIRNDTSIERMKFGAARMIAY